MKNILVSGTSGIVGYGILSSLRASGKKLKLIGTTIYEDSVAQGFCDVFELAPPTTDKDYISWLLRIIKKHQIHLLIPGIEADMYKWNEYRSVIEENGAIIVMNTVSLIDLCRDKWVFYKALEEKKSPYAIESSLTVDYDFLADCFKLPFLLKPRQGFGSKGIVRVNDHSTFLKHKEFIGTVLMAQPIVGNDDEEFTTSAFCDGSGGFYCYMTMRRKLSKDGFTDKAEVVDINGIEDAVKTFCGYFSPVGPTNFQFRLHEGTLKLLEINPRISSSTSIRSKFGYNESAMAVEYYLENKIPQQPEIRQGRAIRYVEDFIFYS
jgi:carbamoyl-phosphate synthase large subunit